MLLFNDADECAASWELSSMISRIGTMQGSFAEFITIAVKNLVRRFAAVEHVGIKMGGDVAAIL